MTPTSLPGHTGVKQALAFLAVFVYATHATQAIAFEWKPGLRQTSQHPPVTGQRGGC